MTDHNRLPPEVSSCQYFMYWWMHARCNFNCAYCFREFGKKNAPPEAGTYTPDHIVGRFDETGNPWHIYMTGGEPLLYPNFIEIAGGLTRKHFISFSTNLSIPDVSRLADLIDSTRVKSLDVSVHIEEREKNAGGVSRLIRNVRYLQDRQFNVRLLYVAYPPLLVRMENDFKRFKEEGAARIEAKVFQGKHNGLSYPQSYSEQERTLLGTLGLSELEREILSARICFLGKKCIAGHRAFVMDPAGRLTRCNSLKDEYGNFFDGTFTPDKAARRCPVRKCSCAYQGLKFAGGKGGPVPPKFLARPACFLLSAFDRLQCR